MDSQTGQLISTVTQEISSDRAHEDIVAITERAPQRLAGTEEIRWMSQFARKAMEEAGVQATVYDLAALLSIPGKASLRLVSPEIREFKALAFAHIPSTGEQGIEGELVYVGSGGEKDYEGKDVRGKITLSELSYSPSRQEKERIGSSHGAIGHIMMNWGPSDSEIIAYGSVKSVWGIPTPETASRMPSRPCITVSRATGEYLRSLSERTATRMWLSASSTEEWGQTQITIGRLSGSQEPEKVVMIGGHMDSWGGGVSCNATGNAAVIELARAFAKHRNHLNRSVWFTLWSGHETGTMAGSSWFCDHFWDELDASAIAYINVDSPGVAGTSEHLTRSSTELFPFHMAIEQQVLPATKCRRVRLTRIGDMSFVGLGVPTLSPRMAFPEEQVKAWNGADLGPWHHSDFMTLDTVDKDILQRDMQVYVSLVGHLANNPILPYDFQPVAREMVQRLTELESKAGESLGLGALLAESHRFQTLSERLAVRSQQLSEDARWPLTGEVLLANRTLIRLARSLNAPTSTVSGKWDQDLYGFSPLRTVFPSLYSIEAASRMGEGTPERTMLATRLRRNRNWIADCLRSANDTAESALQELG